jgi:hypothetical protein
MKVLKRVVAISLLHNDGKVRVSCRNVNNLANAIDGTWLECDMADPSGLETTYDLGEPSLWSGC